DLDSSRLAHFVNGLLGVRNKIKEELNELIGIADDRRKISAWCEVHFHLSAAQRVLVQLQSAFDNRAEVDSLLLRRGRAGKFQKILHDASRATLLPVGQVELALHGFI